MPADVYVTMPVVGLTVHPAEPVVALNVTRPEPEPPEIAAVNESPHTPDDSDVNTNVDCADFPIVNERSTDVASAYCSSPGCAAVIVHVPAPIGVTTAFVAPFVSAESPLTEHTLGVLVENSRTRSLDEVPAIENESSPYVVDGKVGANVIAFDAPVISNERETGVAAA